jgi:lysophospholipase L1-like esterase
VFSDYTHYSDEGSRIMAERLAADILNEFGKR